MRWSDLFEDLEAQLAAQEAAELHGEVVEQTRAARGRVTLGDRLIADTGRPLRLQLRGGTTIKGTLTDVGPDWLLVHEGQPERGREHLVVRDSLVIVQGLSGRADPGRQGRVLRTLDLRAALRALSRDRAVVRACDVVGGVTVGTIDRVGADHLDLSAHAVDVPRRSRDVQSLLTVPYAALACVVHS